MSTDSASYAEIVADLLAEYGLAELPPAFLCQFDGSVHRRGIWHAGDTPLVPAAQVACVDPSPSDGGSTDPEVRQSADRTSVVPEEESS